MKSSIRNLLAVCAVIGACVSTNAATVGVAPSASWVGYMNVSDIPQNGGAYLWGSGWGAADLCANWSGSTLTLSPNTIGDANEYWYIGGGMPGAVGNKIMDANMYVESVSGQFTGQTLRFAGEVLANTLFGSVDGLGNGWTSVAFIKDFAPDYSSFVSSTASLVNGVFDISLATINDPARHIQYGFETIGPNVWITDVGPYGNIQITAIPEPGTLALLGLALGMSAVLRRRQ